MADRIRSAAEGFEQNAESYEAARPSYPAEAIVHIVGHAAIGPGRRVLDLAAGTGKLTRLLVPAGAEVVAVEPVAGMRAVLERGLRDAEVPYDSYDDVDYAAVVAEAGGFSPVELWSHEWEQPSDPESLVARAESVSVVGSLPPDDKQRVLDRVRRFAETHPDLAGRASFPFPYATRVYRCREQ